MLGGDYGPDTRQWGRNCLHVGLRQHVISGDVPHHHLAACWSWAAKNSLQWIGPHFASS